MVRPQLAETHLDHLEAQSVHLLREAYREFKNLVILCYYLTRPGLLQSMEKEAGMLGVDLRELANDVIFALR